MNRPTFCSLLHIFSIYLCMDFVMSMEARYRDLVLKLHNDARAKEGAGDMIKLVWDEDLERQSQEMANRCIFEHSTDEYGENLAADSRKFTVEGLIENAVYNWMNEKKDHRPGSRECMRTGSCHYTQVVWHKTRQLGCAMKRCSFLRELNMVNAWWIVCKYDPMGNIPGEILYQVGRPCSGCPTMKCSVEGLCVPDGEYCDDEEENCMLYKDSGNCQSNRIYMRLYCKKTCGMCKNIGNAENARANCSDNSQYCINWKKKGYCEVGIYTAHVRKECEKTCGICTSTEKETVTKVECVDTQRLCDSWKISGYCTNDVYKAYLRKHCPRSCNSCPGEETDLCNDRLEACIGWTSRGFCQHPSYINYMTRNCRKSCGVCSILKGACEDEHNSCEYWSKLRYCETGLYKPYVEKVCKKSCRFC